MTSRWGRPLESHVVSYDPKAAEERDTLSPKLVGEALAAVRQICSIAEQANPLRQSDMAEKITMSTLESASTLLTDPKALHHLKHETLVSGCIKLMGTVKPSGRLSPLSFEYGYLCFRLMAIALGLCLLERSGFLDGVISDLQSDIQAEVFLTISYEVASVVEQCIGFLSDGTNECDAILGWISSETTPPVLVSREDAKSLLMMLWGDRRLFLEVLMSTYSPGLSGVMFVLWRYLYLERSLKEHPNPDILAAPLCEIQWRYLLVATPDQEASSIQITTDLCDWLYIWVKSPKLATADDTQAILRAFCKRLDPENARIYPPLLLSVIPLLLQFTGAHIVFGSDGHLPRLFRLLTERLWGALLSPKLPRSEFTSCSTMVFDMLRALIDNLCEVGVSKQSIWSDIAKAFAEKDFLELIAKVILTFEPVVEKSSEEYVENTKFMESVQRLLEAQAKLIPRIVLEVEFGENVPELIKLQRHLSFLALCRFDRQLPDGKYHPHYLHYAAYAVAWDEFGRLVGQEDYIESAGVDGTVHCAFSRCAVATQVAANHEKYTCSICNLRVYCSERCQAGDWTIGGSLGPHREQCMTLREAAASHLKFEAIAHMLGP